MPEPVTTDATGLAELLQHSVDRLELAAIRHRGAVRRRLGISDDELVVLLSTAWHESVSLSSLIPLTGLSRSGTGVLVQRLERAGLLERYTDRGDRRVRRIRLTRSGAERLRAARADLASDLEQLVAALTSAELARTRDVIERLADAAETRAGPHAGGAPPPAPDPIWRLWG